MLSMLKTLLKKWWFWVLVAIVLVLGALYLPWYIPWKLEQWGIERQRAGEQAIWEEYEAGNKTLEEAYKNDAYGGATPEKTLELFIEALEAKDYELASKYSVPEKQKEDLAKMPQGVASGGLAALIDAYRNGTLKSTPYQSGDKYEIEVYPKGEEIPFGFVFLLNPYSQKWKILE